MFELSDKAKKLQAQLHEFMDAHIYPNEHKHHEQVEQADFERLIDINLHGVIRMTRAFLPQLRAVEEAHIVNISSIFGIVAPAGQAAPSEARAKRVAVRSRKWRTQEDSNL